MNLCVHEDELDREDRPNTASCLSAGTGDWASGRVDVPGSVFVDVPHESQPQSAASTVAPESSSAPFSFQAMFISLGGKTLMLDVSPDTLVLSKRIENDKAKDQQAKLDQRVYNLRNDLVLAETQAEENRQRVLVLQSEWQALYDQAGERKQMTRLRSNFLREILNLMVWRPQMRKRFPQEILTAS